MKIVYLILAHKTPNQWIRNLAVRESPEQGKIEERARGVGRNNEEQWREGESSEEEEAGKRHLTAFFRRFEGFHAVQRREARWKKGEPRKNNSKKGQFLAIFGLNLEKEEFFGEGF
jgi:hypothetical protein